MTKTICEACKFESKYSNLNTYKHICDQEAVSSWELNWESFKYNELSLPIGAIHKNANKQIKDFFRQTIKTERDQAVEERDRYWNKIIKNPKVIREQAVKEVRERIVRRMGQIGRNEVIDELLRI